MTAYKVRGAHSEDSQTRKHLRESSRYKLGTGQFTDIIRNKRMCTAAMHRFRLSSDEAQIQLVATGPGSELSFMVMGPTTESAYIEELLEQEFGSLTLNPAKLFRFLSESPWIRDYFQQPQLVEGDLETALHPVESEFRHQPLGQKLVTSGLLDLKELEELLTSYRPYAQTQRFGEFLKLNLQVPQALLDFLLYPDIYGDQGFNDQRLGERLVSLGCLSESQLEEALQVHQQSGRRIGEVLAEQGLITETMARFFSKAKVNSNGQVDYAPD